MKIKIIAKTKLPSGMVHINYTIDGLMHWMNLPEETAAKYPVNTQIGFNPFSHPVVTEGLISHLNSMPLQTPRKLSVKDIDDWKADVEAKTSKLSPADMEQILGFPLSYRRAGR